MRITCRDEFESLSIEIKRANGQDTFPSVAMALVLYAEGLFRYIDELEAAQNAPAVTPPPFVRLRLTDAPAVFIRFNVNRIESYATGKGINLLQICDRDLLSIVETPEEIDAMLSTPNVLSNLDFSRKTNEELRAYMQGNINAAGQTLADNPAF